MRDLHSRLLAAVLEGEGLGGVAELASEESGGPVAIVLPARGLAASAPERPLGGLTEYTRARIAGGRPEHPEPIDLELSVVAGTETVGLVLALPHDDGVPAIIDREEVLRAAAAAALTEVAVTEARDAVAHDLRGSFLEDLRAGRLDGAETARRAVRLGCDLARGAVALAAEVRSSQPLHAAALVVGEHQGAIAEPLEGRIYAILPARGGDDAPERTQDAARAVIARLRPHGPAAFSSFYADPADLRRAIGEAELVLDVISRDERLAEQLDGGITNGVYRVLFRALVTDPDEVRQFYEDTVAPLVAHDREYRTELLATLEAYLDNDCNMNATARTIYAHRHTIGHRLGRIRELTGLDPSHSEDRERLGLGIKTYRIISPTLPR
jgi:PucR C-terminal helix-turn-helix domain/GGDEF-like domain